jgi:hypothetical protein
MNRPLLRAACVAAVAALLYLPSLRFAFTYDDAIVVENQPQVTGHAWGALLVSPYHVGTSTRVPTGIYRPLTTISLALNHAATGLAPWSYHLINVLLHALVTCLVLALGDALGLPPPAALVGALAFAVHPVHVEAVANVAGRAELLSSACALAALVLYVRMRRRRAFTMPRAIAVACLVGAGVFAKENVITLAGVVVLWEILRHGRAREAIPAIASVVAPIAVYLAARLAVLGSLTLGPGAVTAIENPVVGLTGISRLATVLATFGHAISLLLTPLRLAPDYGFADSVPSRSLLEGGALVGMICLALIVVAVGATWRRAPVVGFLLGASLITYSIVSNAFVVIGTILGDRLLYLPSAFACLLFGAGVSALAARVPRLSPAVAAIIVTLLAVRAGFYESRWRSDADLFEYAARVAPGSVRCLGSWGAILAENGRLEEAMPYLNRAVTVAPDFVPARLNRAAAEISTEELDAAEADARHVLLVDPSDPVAKKQLEAIRGLR